MSIELTKKIIRCSVVGMLFLALITLQGTIGSREAHKIVFMLMLISVFSLVLKNVWMTLFVLWTVFLYAFFKFSCGNIYVLNVFLGTVLYYIVKVSFKKEHINFYINGVLWFVFANIL